MKLDSNIVSFGRHESFPMRFGWISKGLTTLVDGLEIFRHEDATVLLGVDKNMVSSMQCLPHAASIIQVVGKSSFEPALVGQIAFCDGT